MTRALDNWIEDRLDVVARTGPEVRLRACLFCGRSRTMKVNVERLRFICFHEDCQSAGGLLRLVQAVEDVSYDEAIRIMGNLMRGVTKARPHTEVASMLDALRRGEPLAEKESESADDDLRIPVPREFIPCWDGERWRIPKYLTQERRLRRADLQRWALGFCKRGTYRGRIIVPIRCDGMSSFVARDFTGRRDRPKYLAPAEVGGFMLFGYDEVRTPGRVVAVEGVFDAIRLWSYGIQAVAYFGDHLTPAHVELLERLDGLDLVLMPDGNDPKAQARAVRSARALEARFASVKLALLAEGVDPDTAGRAEIARALADAHLPKDHEGAAVRLRNLRRSPLEL